MSEREPKDWRLKPGVRAVVLDDAGRVLLLRRPDAEELYGGHWNLPGGGKEPGESYLGGALRELEEETGLVGIPTGAAVPFTFPGGHGRAFLVRHPSGRLNVARRESDAAQWFYPGDLPHPLMPPTAEIVTLLAGTGGDRPMGELNLTADRLHTEQWVAQAVAPWLKAAVERRAVPMSKGIGDAEDADEERAMRRLSNLRRPGAEVMEGRDLWIGAADGDDDEGEEVLFRSLVRARKLGMAEAARAILTDARAGQLPEGHMRGYRKKTLDRLRATARRTVRLVNATTEKRLATLAIDAEAGDVFTMVQKLYDMSRAELIAVDICAQGYAEGVAEVLTSHGYAFVYPRTMGDDKVCPVCRSREGLKMSIKRFLKVYPLHVRCRCYPHTSPLAEPRALNWRAKKTTKVIMKGLATMETSLMALRALTGEQPPMADLIKAFGGGKVDPEILRQIAKKRMRGPGGQFAAGKVTPERIKPNRRAAAAGPDDSAAGLVERAKAAGLKLNSVELRQLKTGNPNTVGLIKKQIEKAEAKKGKPAGTAPDAPKPGTKDHTVHHLGQAVKAEREAEAAANAPEQMQAPSDPSQPDATAPTGPKASTKAAIAPAPQHLIDATNKALKQLRTLKPGTPEFEHVRTQYEGLRQAVRGWNKSKGKDAAPAPVELPPKPAHFDGELRTPQQFELAAAAATTKEDAVALGKYFEAVARRDNLGTDYKDTWKEIKAAIASLPTQEEVEHGKAEKQAKLEGMKAKAAPGGAPSAPAPSKPKKPKAEPKPAEFTAAEPTEEEKAAIEAENHGPGADFASPPPAAESDASDTPADDATKAKKADAGKPAHEMTFDEFQASPYAKNGDRPIDHQLAISRALHEGKTVPDHVLDEHDGHGHKQIEANSKPAESPASGEKPPHEMTWDEYRESKIADELGHTRNDHAKTIIDAVKAGKPVRDELLDEHWGQGRAAKAKYDAYNAKESARLAAGGAPRERIGGGNTGDVYKEGNEVVKHAVRDDGSRTAEGEVYDALKGTPGVAAGRADGDEIRMPHYPDVVSVDTKKRDEREQHGELVRANFDRMLHAVNELSAAGYSYNDPLQFGKTADGKLDLLDFSNCRKATKENGDRPHEDNLGLLANYCDTFGAPEVGNKISDAKEALAHMQLFDAFKTVGKKSPHSEEVTQAVYDQLGGKKPRNAYHVDGDAPEGLPSLPAERGGGHIVLSREPLDEATIAKHNMTPIVHRASRKGAEPAAPKGENGGAVVPAGPGESRVTTRENAVEAAGAPGAVTQEAETGMQPVTQEAGEVQGTLGAIVPHTPGAVTEADQHGDAADGGGDPDDGGPAGDDREPGEDDAPGGDSGGSTADGGPVPGGKLSPKEQAEDEAKHQERVGAFVSKLMRVFHSVNGEVDREHLESK